MRDNGATGQVASSAAEIYDRFFVPAIFEQWAEPLCMAAGLEPGGAVLDVACGTGATTRVARNHVGVAGAVTGLDCNEGMLQVARSREQSIGQDIAWCEGRAEKLPFAVRSFDAVLCQFGLMFFDNRIAALAEMRRVLRPDGRLAISVWDDVRKSSGYAALISLIDRLFGTAPADALRAPFCLGSIDDFRDVLVRGGLEQADIATHEGRACFPSIAEWVRTDVRGWTLSEMIDGDQLAELLQAAETELKPFCLADGSVAFPAPAHIATWVSG